MGNFAVYIYDNITHYMNIYPRGQTEESENHIDGMFVGDKKLAVVTNLMEKVANYKPDITRTLIYYNGGIDAFEKKFAKNLDHVTDIEWDVKTNVVTFAGVDNEIKLPCARHFGEKEKPKFLRNTRKITGYVMFDEQRNKLNLVISNDDN